MSRKPSPKQAAVPKQAAAKEETAPKEEPQKAEPVLSDLIHITEDMTVAIPGSSKPLELRAGMIVRHALARVVQSLKACEGKFEAI